MQMPEAAKAGVVVYILTSYAHM